MSDKSNKPANHAQIRPALVYELDIVWPVKGLNMPFPTSSGIDYMVFQFRDLPTAKSALSDNRTIVMHRSGGHYCLTGTNVIKPSTWYTKAGAKGAKALAVKNLHKLVAKISREQAKSESAKKTPDGNSGTDTTSTTEEATS